MRFIRNTFYTLPTLLLIIFIALPAHAQFGRNKIQYKDLEWEVLTTPHFYIHFYRGSENFAMRAGLVMEDGYQMLSKKLNTTLPWKVPVILYSSHNDFLQTNVQLQLLPESVQAFAEPSRKRIVLPFTGSYPSFAHTAIHELAHVFTFQIIYNRLLDNVFSRNALFGLPLWVMEGVAEYLSIGWDTQTDMIIRDGVIHDYLGDLSYASGFANYKQGQSVFNYIEQTYGREKVLEILEAMAVTRNASSALEKTVGLTVSEISEKWKKAQRKHYWPMIADKTEAEELGRRLTNHIKDRAVYNTKPVMSPDGERIAFFSSRGGIIDIYVMSTVDGKILKKLVNGYRTNQFESLKFFTSSLSFSPDGKRLTFVAKTDGRDMVYIIDSFSGKVLKKIDVNADGLASPTWSPKGGKICVSAVFAGRTDLVLIDSNTGEFERLTNDVADQLNPRFFPDGERIAFSYFPETTSSTPLDLSAESKRTLNEMDFLAADNVEHNASLDIYAIDLKTREVSLLVATKGDDNSPVPFDEGRKMIFVSDATGVSNLYVADLEKGEYRRVTDVLSGAFTPDVNEKTNRFTFSAFVQAGWDIYVSDELDHLIEKEYDRAAISVVTVTADEEADAFMNHHNGPDIPLATLLARARVKPHDAAGGDSFSVADDDSLRYDVTPLKPGPLVIGSKTGDTKQTGAGGTVEGLDAPVGPDEPVTRGGTVSKYKTRLAPDFVGQGAGLYFSTGFGLGFANTIAMSDMLGNHRMVFSFNLFRDLADSDLLATYFYLKRRINYGVGVFQFKNFLNSRVTSIGESFQNYRLFSERNYGVFGLISLPLDTFNRVDLEVQSFVSERQFFDAVIVDPVTGQQSLVGGDESTRNLIEPTVSFVHDAALWSSFGPVEGSRYVISASNGFGFGDNGVSRSTGFLDYRKYHRLWYRNSLAFRLLGAVSEGDNPRTFFLGGPTTLRGYDYQDLEGSRLAMLNVEYRFPLVDALVFGWPGRWGFRNLGGSLFFDSGAAWHKNDITPFRKDVNGLRFQDLKGDIGFGTHFYFGYFLLNFQLAWKTDLREVGGSQFHFFIGPSF